METEIIFIEKKKECEGIYSFIFQKPNELTWKSGQHAIFKLKTPVYRGKDFRIFSMSSVPNEESLMFTTKIRPKLSDFKKELMNLKKGDKLDFNGPYGAFHLIPNQKVYVGIATGIGITPFKAIIEEISVDSKLKDTKFEQVYASKDNNFAFKDELDNYTKNKNINIHYSNNHEKTMEILKKLIPNKEEALYYIAGPPNAVDSMKEFLEKNDISLNQIRTDNFIGY